MKPQVYAFATSRSRNAMCAAKDNTDDSMGDPQSANSNRHWANNKNDERSNPVGAIFRSKTVAEENLERNKRVLNLKRHHRSNSDEERDKTAKLFSVIRKGKLQKVQELLRSGVKTNTVDRNNKDNTPLHCAVEKGNEEIVEELLLPSWKTNIDAQNNEGDTPLHIATLTGSEELVKLLISNNATTSIKNKYDETPLELSDDPAIIDAFNKQSRIVAFGQHANPSVQTVHHQQPQKKTGSDGGASTSKKPRISSKVEVQESDNGKRLYTEELELQAGRMKKLKIAEEYAASGLKSSLHGTIYQQKLLMVVLKRGLDRNYSFRLATEMDAAEKFDDLVFQFSRGNKHVYRFLQAKHKQNENKKISVNDLMTQTDGEFSLQKYFNSYRKIKQNPEFNGQNDEIKDLIICTNIGFKFGDKHGDFKLDNDIFHTEKSEDGNDKIDDILKTVLFRFKDNFPGKNQIVSILKNTSDLVKLTSKLAECVLDGKFVNNDQKSNFFELYQCALAKEVIDAESKKLQPNFVDGVNLSPETENFREAFENLIDERRKTFNFDGNPNIKREDLNNFVTEIIALLTKYRTDKIVKVERRSKMIKNNFDKLAGYVLIKKAGDIKFSSAFLNNHPLPGNLGDFRGKLYSKLSYDAYLFKNLSQYRFDVYKDFKTCEEIYVDKSTLWKGIKETKLKLSNNFGKTDLNLESVDQFVEKITLLIEESESRGEKVVKIQKKDNIVSKNIDKLAQHVLIENDGKIEFSSLFLNGQQLVGNLTNFRSQLAAKLDIKKLDKYQFEISNFPKLRLPNDSIDNVERDIESFLNHLVFAVDQPNEVELGNIIESEMSETKDINLIDSDFIASKFQKYVMDWMKDKKGRFLTHDDGKDLFDDIRKKLAKLVLTWPTLEYQTRIREFGITFSYAQRKLHSFLELANEKLILNFISPPNTILGAIKVHQTLKEINNYKYSKDDGYIFISLGSFLRRHYRVTEAFSSPSHNLLVIECKRIEGNLQELYNQLCSLVTFKKKIILITQEESILAIKCREYFKDKYEEVRDEASSLIDLTLESQNKILKEGTFIFQGEQVNLGALINQDSKHLIDAEVLSKLVNNEDVEIGEPLPDLRDVESYYIPRSFNRRIEIKSNLFENTDKFFVLYDSQVNEFDLQQGQDLVVISDTEAHFQELSNTYDRRNVHWLRKDDLTLTWQRSHGTLSKLREFVNKRIQKISLLKSEKVTEINDKVVIVAAEPGMGKSTVLTDLAIKTKKSDPLLWVARINLLVDCSPELQNRTDKEQIFNAEAVFEFLLKAINLRTELDKKLFKDRYERGKVALFFDGYDEISPDYKEEVGKLLRFLKRTNVGKVWVTTRPYNIRNWLEDELSTFSYTLLSFSVENQRSFLEKFWMHVLGVRELRNESSRIFIDEILQRFSKSIKDNGKKFVTIPLHIKMVADVLKGTFADFYKSNTEQLSDEQQQNFISSENFNLLNLFTDFFKVKFDEILFGEKAPGMNKADSKVKRLLNTERKQVMENHKKLALCSLVRRDELEILLCSELKNVIGSKGSLLEEVEFSKEKTGIIDRVVGDKPVFVHQTFAEYFAAFWFAENWQTRKEVRDFLIDNIFSEKYDVTRNFFDHILAKTDNDNGTSAIHTAVLNNDELKVESLLKIDGNIIVLTDQAGRTPLHLAAAYDYREIVQHLLKALDKLQNSEILGVRDKLFNWSPLSYSDKSSYWNVADLLLQRGASCADMLEATSAVRNGVVNEDGQTLLHTAAKEGYLKFAEVLVSHNANVYAVDKDNKTPLHWSAQNGQLDLVKYFIDDQNVDFNVEDKQGRLPVFLATQYGQFNIVKYFIDDKKVDINIESEYGTVLLHWAAQYGHLQILQYLIEKCANSNLINKIGTHGGTPLHVAAQCGKLDIVRYLLKNGAQFDIVDDSTPLHWAALYGRLDVIEYFINVENADVEAPEYDGSTPLHLAAVSGHVESVRWLVAKGANLYARNGEDRIPLHEGTRTGNLEIINSLISEDKGNLNIVDRNGDTPLHVAAGFFPEMVRYFIDERGAEFYTKNNNGQTLLHRAASESNVLDVVKYLLDEKEFDLNTDDNEGSTPLHLAARFGRRGVVNYFLDRIGDNSVELIELLFNTEKYGLTPLHYAVLNNHVEVIELLSTKMMNYQEHFKQLVHGHDGEVNEEHLDSDSMIRMITEEGVNSFRRNKYHTILHEAVRGGNLATVKLIVDRIAELGVNRIDSLDHQGNTPLMWAAMYNKADAASLLIKYAANVNVRNNAKKSVIHLAVTNGHEDMVNFFIEIVDDVDVKDECDRTPLHWAAEERQWDILKILVHGGANVNDFDKDRRTALHWAAADGNLNLVKFLIDNGTDYHFRDKDGNAPLHLAANGGELDTMKYLIEVKGVDCNTLNDHGQTPLHLAHQGGKLRAVAYLLDKVAQISQLAK